MKAKRPKNFLQYLWYYIQGILITGIILGLGFSGTWAWRQLHSPNALPFHHINIIGQLTFIPPLELKNVILQNLNGGFFVLNTDVLRDAIESIRWVDQVDVQRIWPNSLQITIKEQIPIARYGQTSLINAYGDIFNPPVDTIPKNLPTFYGPPKEMPHMVAFYHLIQPQLSKININIKQLRVNNRLSWNFTLSNGIKIILGQDDLLLRCHRLVHLYPLIIRANANDVERIDLRYPNGLAIKWKPQNTKKPSV